MCEDCRVTLVTEDDFDRRGAPRRPNVRTTDDYLRERERSGKRVRGDASVWNGYFIALNRNFQCAY